MTGAVVTVVVCTRDRASILPRCLTGLARQTMPQDRFEIIVVDNGSTDDTTKVVGQFEQEFHNLRLLYEPRVGVSRARNLGLTHTRTPLLAFNDDDHVPRRDWLEKLLAPFELAEPPAVVGGDNDPVWETGRPAWLTDTYLHYYSVNLEWSSTGRFLLEGEWLFEGNCAYDTDTLREAGGFQVDMGRRGSLLLSGENFVNEIIAQNGGHLYYTPKARKFHFVEAERLTPEWLARRVFWGGVTRAMCEARLANYVEKAKPLEELTLPVTELDWACMIPVEPTHISDDNMQRLFDLGYLLQRLELLE